MPRRRAMASVRPNAVTNSRSEAVRAESYRTSRRRVRRCRVPFRVDHRPGPRRRNEHLCRRHDLGASRQPHDADEIDDTRPEPVPDAIMRSTREARSMIDRNADHTATSAPDERGHEPVHVIEVRELEEQRTPEHLET